MYPLGKMCREDGALLVDLVVKVVDLNQDTKEYVNFRDDFLLLPLRRLALGLAIDLHLGRSWLCKGDIFSIDRNE